MSRAAILDKIRTGLAAAAADPARQRAVAARLSEPPRPLVLSRTDTAAAARVELFKSFLAAQSADLVGVPDSTQIPAAVAAYLRTHHVPLHLRMGTDPYLEALPWEEAPDLAREAGPARSGDAAGLSRAIAGVAETGTLVLASGPHNPVTLAFQPDTHLVVVTVEAIVASYEEAVARLEAECGPALPRTLNLISGPSRTGDIGGRIVMGAHGPRRLAVFLVA